MADTDVPAVQHLLSTSQSMGCIADLAVDLFVAGSLSTYFSTAAQIDGVHLVSDGFNQSSQCSDCCTICLGCSDC